MVLFCNLLCVWLHKICENKLGGCKKSFSWLGGKVNKKIYEYGHNTDNSSMDLPTG